MGSTQLAYGPLTEEPSAVPFFACGPHVPEVRPVTGEAVSWVVRQDNGWGGDAVR